MSDRQGDGNGKPRKRPRQERSRFTVDVILRATEQVLAEHGVAGATTNRIAEVAGVSIGSLYQYFPNKQVLIEIVRERSNSDFATEVNPRIEALFRLPVAAAARSLVEILVERHRETLGVHNALAEDDGSLHHQLEERWIQDVVAYLTAHRDEIRPTNLELAARIGLEIVESLVHGVAVRTPERLDDPEYVDELHALLLGYFCPGLVAQSNSRPIED